MPYDGRELRSEVRVGRPIKTGELDSDDASIAATIRGLNPYSAIWDTGATCTAISARVINDLNLKPTGTPIRCSTANRERWADRYSVSVLLPNWLVVSVVQVIDGDFDGQDVLIGMDIISMGDFYITQHEDPRFGFRIPSIGTDHL